MMQGHFHHIQNKQQFEQFVNYVFAYFEEHKEFQAQLVVPMKNRSLRQNNAIHLYCQNLATVFNENDLTVVPVVKSMKEGADIPWSSESIKELIWRPIQLAKVGHDKTSKLETKQVADVYDTINAWSSIRHGIAVEFPSMQERKHG